MILNLNMRTCWSSKLSGRRCCVIKSWLILVDRLHCITSQTNGMGCIYAIRKLNWNSFLKLGTGRLPLSQGAGSDAGMQEKTEDAPRSLSLPI